MSGSWGGSNNAWRHHIPTVMRRDQRTCQIQGPDCTIDATEVDHIIPRYLDGSHDLDNLQAACHDCHLTKSRHEGIAARTAKTLRARIPREPHPGLTNHPHRHRTR